MRQFQTQKDYIKWIITLTLWQLFIVPSIALSETPESDNINYNFIKNTNGYHIKFKITIDAPIECLLSVVFEYSHLIHFTESADKITLIKKGNDWNIVQYDYDKFLFRHISTYKKILYKEKNLVTFEMIDNELHESILPKIISSKGYYKIISNPNNSTIEYFQEAVVEDKNLNIIYFQIIKNKAFLFAKKMKQYSQDECSL